MEYERIKTIYFDKNGKSFCPEDLPKTTTLRELSDLCFEKGFNITITSKKITTE